MESFVPNRICELLGIDLPLLAFSHCRDVVVEVSKAGGFGVLGASAHSPEGLEQELAWIDRNIGGRPYGVDILVPGKLAVDSPDLTRADVLKLIPEEHLKAVLDLLTEHGVEASLPDGANERWGNAAVSVGKVAGERLMDVAFEHPISLIANALGVPTPEMIERARSMNIPVAALVGAKEHAIKQADAGVDIIVAQGTEAGGHCGEIATMVLVPEVIRAVKDRGNPIVLGAGGIITGAQMAAALALGADGVWTGSVWLTTHESETEPLTQQKMIAASSRDAVRSRGRTGKPARQLRSSWTEMWEQPDTPDPLPMPLQMMISEPALRRVDAVAAKGHEGAKDLATYFVGQGVGLLDSVRYSKDVVREMAEEMTEAIERLQEFTG
jgi:NAD(P)H-dependent flavin oxidoreductase YrpB (nitropropane dioxygenase family)